MSTDESLTTLHDTYPQPFPQELWVRWHNFYTEKTWDTDLFRSFFS